MLSTATRSNLTSIKSSTAGLAKFKSTGSNYSKQSTFITGNTAQFDSHTEKILDKARKRNKKVDVKVKLFATGPPLALKQKEVKIEKFSKEQLLEIVRKNNVKRGLSPDHDLEPFLPKPKPVRKVWPEELNYKEKGFFTIKRPKTAMKRLFTQSSRNLASISPTISKLKAEAMLTELEATTLTEQEKRTINRQAAASTRDLLSKSEKKMKAALELTTRKIKRTGLHTTRHLKERVELTTYNFKDQLHQHFQRVAQEYKDKLVEEKRQTLMSLRTALTPTERHEKYVENRNRLLSNIEEMIVNPIAKSEMLKRSKSNKEARLKASEVQLKLKWLLEEAVPMRSEQARNLSMPIESFGVGS